MKRMVMISDIHGCIQQLDRLLQLIAFHPKEDQLILLGDYVDRGPNSKETVNKVIELVREQGAIALRGNHDQRLVDLIRNDSHAIRSKFLQHGGAQTIQSYCDLDLDHDVTDEILDQAIETIRVRYSHHIDFLSDLPLYHEDENHIYVHAGLNPAFANWKEQSEHDFMYIKDPFIRSDFDLGKTVVFGHTRAMAIHGSADVWFGRDKIGIDGGCAYGMQLNGLIYQDEIYKTVRIEL
ncbi:metallophosphoesterase family protein [Paenibacillus sp. LHD-117]|uniref:metallophosphoesterase family protein n=1 Tax=Paenibacillus sp. LHD-117 TaxID=3071412 RepID=UPI0027DEEAC8|nr:metallophosphoesterase family protein [Paenibacillus sp. LHD-117]MDQ6421758.1 metallophosphoesterase family protein [Paenibacillus sp. LHD-117]